MRIIALADDMTGALEVGAKFAACGITPVVTAGIATTHHVVVQVIDTETRHLSAGEAEECVSRILHAIPEPALIYKKTDSTLRGNIGAELRAIAARFPDWRIAYAPAYPALGRTVAGGLLLVDGIPVHETAFGSDALNPVKSSRVRDVIGVDLHCTIFDGQTDDDVRRAAMSVLRDPAMRIAAGPAAFAGALAAAVDVSRGPVPVLPAMQRCIVINGSRHPASAAQIEHALEQRCVSHAADASWRIIEAPNGNTSAEEYARRMGEAAVSMLAIAEYDGVIVFGGDTTYALLRALRITELTPIGEPLPGVAMSQCGSLKLVSKAGGFGAPELICRLRDVLNGGIG